MLASGRHMPVFLKFLLLEVFVYVCLCVCPHPKGIINNPLERYA